MNFLAAIALAAVAANICLGAFVLIYRRKRLVNQLFFAFSVSLAAWCLAIYILASPLERAAAVVATRYLIYASLVSSVFFLHLVLGVFGTKSRKLLIPSYIALVGLIIGNLGGTIVIDARPLSTGNDTRFWYGVAGPMAWLAPLFAFAVIGLAIRLLRETARISTGIRRAQANYLLVAIVPAAVIGFHDLAGLFFEHYPGTEVTFLPLIPVASVFWASLVAYTILRYRFIDLDAAIIRGMTHALLMIILVSPCALGLVLAQYAYLGVVHADFSLVATGICAAAVLLFPRAREVTEGTLQGLLLRRSGDYRTALARFSRESSRILDLPVLIESVNSALVGALAVRHSAIYIADHGGDTVRLLGAKGETSANLPKVFTAQDSVVGWAKNVREPVVREELQLGGRPLARHIGAEMDTLGIDVAVPLMTSEELEGVVFLGPKESGVMFTQEDIELLTILASQLSVALENARLYEDLKRSRELIQRSERLSVIGTMAAGLAHEIRNPLVSIRTFTQLLPEHIDDVEFRTKFQDLTLSEVDRICALINELLAFARPTPAQLQKVDLNDCLDRICLLLESQARNGGVQLKRNLKSGLRSLTADEDQIKQVVMNVVLNAIQSCADGGVVEVASYENQASGRPFLCIEISDTGRGIDEDLLAHIFDPFFTTRRDGTGLGLSIAHQIVRSHGGFIDVRSEKGKGTVFYINLPFAPPPRRSDEPELIDADDLRIHG